MSTTKRVLCISLSVLFLWMTMQTAWAKEQETTYVLLEAQSGTIIDANNEETSLYGAGMTKLMSYLLFMEALHSGVVKSDEMVTLKLTISGIVCDEALMPENNNNNNEASTSAKDILFIGSRGSLEYSKYSDVRQPDDQYLPLSDGTC